MTDLRERLHHKSVAWACGRLIQPHRPISPCPAKQKDTCVTDVSVRSHLFVSPIRLVGCALAVISGLAFSGCGNSNPQSAAQPATAHSGGDQSAASVLVLEGYLQHYNFIQHAGKYYALAQSEGAFSLEKVQGKKYKDFFVADSVDGLKKQIMESMTGPNQNDSEPLLIANGYKDHINVIRYRGKYYGLGQEEGAFIPEKVLKKQYKRVYMGSSPTEIDGQLH
jgi:hypothetical protein